MSEAEKIERKGQDIPLGEEGQKTILVVEDDRTHRALMDKILKSCEFATVQAENGIIALSKIDSGQHFDLIIMDWDMPELDGLNTVMEIRKSEIRDRKSHTPVVAFTANRQPGDQEKCLAAGMDAYLPKDVWMPRWRDTLIDNLQGLTAGNFDLNDFEDPGEKQESIQTEFDPDAFDVQALEQSASLLKDELGVAVDEYLEDAAAYIRDIKDGLEKGDSQKVTRGSHPLKSNSKGFGLLAVSQIAEAINVSAEKGSLEPIESLLSQLEEAFHKAEKKLRETIKNAGY